MNPGDKEVRMVRERMDSEGMELTELLWTLALGQATTFYVSRKNQMGVWKLLMFISAKIHHRVLRRDIIKLKVTYLDSAQQLCEFNSLQKKGFKAEEGRGNGKEFQSI